MSYEWMHSKSFIVSEILKIIQVEEYVSDHNAGIKYTSLI
jgi:hypothetical protein